MCAKLVAARLYMKHEADCMQRSGGIELPAGGKGEQDTHRLICCTGTNACYMELLGRITKWLPHYRPRTPDMVVNIEWPGFQVSTEQLLRHQMNAWGK